MHTQAIGLVASGLGYARSARWAERPVLRPGYARSAVAETFWAKGPQEHSPGAEANGRGPGYAAFDIGRALKGRHKNAKPLQIRVGLRKHTMRVCMNDLTAVWFQRI